MKSLSKITKYSSIIERYDLCDAFSESEMNKGLIICYALSTCRYSTLISLELEAEHEEIGVPLRWSRRYSRQSFESTFNNIDKFMTIYAHDDFGYWMITSLYQDTEVKICGKRSETEIGVSYPIDKTINLLPWLISIEDATHKYDIKNHRQNE